MSEQKKLAPNSLSFIALTNEFCQAVEHAESATREDFLANMLKIFFPMQSNHRHIIFI